MFSYLYSEGNFFSYLCLFIYSLDKNNSPVLIYTKLQIMKGCCVELTNFLHVLLCVYVCVPAALSIREVH